MQFLMVIKDVIKYGILLWKTWKIHGFVLFTFSIQIFLFFLAPFRKNTASGFLGVMIWSAYQLWETAMSRSLALIRSARFAVDGTIYFDLYTLWAVFMMVYFGGPDTITALAMEDNELWLRSYLQFASQVVNIVNAVLATPRDKRQSRPLILLPILFIFVAGVVKSFERILSLMNSSPGHFQRSLLPRKPVPGRDYAYTMERYDQHRMDGIPVRFVEAKESPAEGIDSDTVSTSLAGGSVEGNTAMVLSDTQVLKHACRFYDKFKGMYVGQIFSCLDRKETRDYFLPLSSESAFRILETEMKFAYQGFFTKMSVFRYGPWVSLRFIALDLEGFALAFWISVYQSGFHSVEVSVTLCLTVGVVFIDVIAAAGFYLSDRVIGHTIEKGNETHRALSLIFYARRRRWGEPEKPETSYILRALHTLLSIFFRQWSESISQFNLVLYCINDSRDGCSSFCNTIGAKDTVDGWKYVSAKWFSKDLRHFIFDELKYKSAMAEDLDTASKISSSRGGWILYNTDSATFEPWINKVKYEESVLMWHIATELCYETEEPEERRFRELSKTLSDYMLYIVIRQPKMMSEVAPMSDVVFKDTCKEFKEFFRRAIAPNLPYAKRKARESANHTETCRRTMDVRARIPPGYVQEEGNKSVLLRACDLANKLKELKNERPGQWELTSKVWLELLCYAASQTPGDVHAAQLAKGGELVTLVRLLMLHLGISDQFQQARGHGISRKVLTTYM